MRQMKDSGIEWIGEIPESWSIERGKNIMQKLERPVLEDDGVITCFRDGEVTLRSNRREEGFTISTQETGYQGIEPGDLVVHGMDGFAGSIGISDSRGKATPVLNVLDSNEDKKYLMYYMRSAAYCGLFLSLATGIRIRTCDTNWNKLKNVLYLLPPLSEQQAISAYLDCQCGLIDNIIEKTKVSVEEYKKLRQAVITQAVTKGVRGDRPMKDSGIEWIGEIPEEWIVCKIHNYCRLKTGSTPSTSNPEWFDGSIQWFTPGDFSDNYNLIESQRKLSQKAIDDEVCSLVDKDTVLLVGIGATAGKVGISNTPCYFNQQITAILSENNVILSKYLLYWIVANTKFIRETANYTTLPILNNQTINNYLLLLPNNIEEQKEIAAYLDKKCAEIDTLITKKEQFLTELESYKKSMIYEYVTGKKEVPQS